MLALITGGTSGIGRAIAQELDHRGYDLLLVGTKEIDLEKLQSLYHHKVNYFRHDLTKVEEVYKLLDETEKYDIDLFFDNAGFGDFGKLSLTDDDKEMAMINLNCKAMHLLLKHFLIRFTEKNSGRVMITSSAAAFAASPYMATYYATKGYIFKLGLGYYRELKDLKSRVTLSILCPGPVITNFEDRANVTFTIKALTAEKVGRLAVKKTLRGKTLIIPGIKFKIMHLMSRLFPEKLSAWATAKSARRRKTQNRSS